MFESEIADAIKVLRQRSLVEGGFAATDRGDYRTDVTAWAILALSASGYDQAPLSRARTRLTDSQHTDGRVCISPDHPEVYWPTPLAILAWHKSPAHQVCSARAVKFLLEHSGKDLQKGNPDIPVTMDLSLKGWSWVTGTSAWIDPTALSIIALKVTGHGNHPRVKEGVQLLLDRQCPQGGWNYGNTRVFGAELRPMPENTGMGLDALQSLTARSSLELSLAYLKAAVQNLRTPIALSWGLFGLGAWGERPAEATARLAECWQRQERYGVYSTTPLSLLILT
jgi:hypothetical protein